MQPGLSGTVINNYYGNEPGTEPDTRSASWEPADRGNVEPANYTPDNPDPGSNYASDQDVSSDQDFASDSDFSGGGNDDYA
jgi:hypothetical protein